MAATEERTSVRFLKTNLFAVLGYGALVIALGFTILLAFGASAAKPLNGSQSALLALISAISQGGAAFAFTKQDARNRARDDTERAAERTRAEADAAEGRRALQAQIDAMPSPQAVAFALRRLAVIGGNIVSARGVAEQAHDEPNPKDKQRAVGYLSATLSLIEQEIGENVLDWTSMYPKVIDDMKEQSGE